MNIARLTRCAASLAVIVGTLGIAPACSSSTASTGAPQDPGATGGATDTAASAPDTNPDGVPYPTKNLGTSARVGGIPGNTMQNYKFLGYPGGDMSKGLQPISLASFFDPTGAKYKMIRIQASGTWCPHCQKETQVAATLSKEFADRKVAWIISLAEGPVQGTAATKTDLDGWVAAFQAPYTQFLDPGNKNFGIFYNAAALPWNATLNAKTMEIIESTLGGFEEPGAMLENIDSLLKVVDGL
ncbi:MAG: hypothetical protein JWP97_6412 [Labilithrix sp.]|nr:hypothetical protein [Labilithrix sp.]